jgi:hypothetical protein
VLGPDEIKLLSVKEREDAIASLDIARVKAEADRDYRKLFALEFHRNTLNQPLSFDEDPWLIDIYADEHNEIVVRKSVQCGISEMAIIIVLAECYRGKSVLYVVPSREFKTDFSSKRIDDLFDRVPFYRAGVGRTDNKGLKKLFTGFFKLVGSNVRAHLASDPAQVAIVDEVDDCAQANLPLVETRTEAAKKLTGEDPVRIDIGNPTIEGFGVDEKYQDSDQRAWHITCDHCASEQILDWFVNFVEQTDSDKYRLLDTAWVEGCGRDIRGYCKDCGGEIDRHAAGRWIAGNPESTVHGYHISQLFTGQNSIATIWKRFQKALRSVYKLQVFYNSVLGLPFTNAGFKITPALIRDCVDDEYTFPAKATGGVAGVDVGKDLHISVSTFSGGVRRKVCVTHFPMTDKMEGLLFTLRTYGVTTCVIDGMPETTQARKFQRLARPYGIRVFLCEFQRGLTISEMKVDKKKGQVKVDRTQAFDCVFDSYKGGEVVVGPDFRDYGRGDWIHHMGENTRVEIEDGTGNVHYEWRAGSGRKDHYHLADVYELLAAEIAKTRITVQGK